MNRKNEQQLKRLLSLDTTLSLRYQTDRAVFVLVTEYGSVVCSGTTLNELVERHGQQQHPMIHATTERVQ